jgi:hypothetical protein
MSEENTNSTTTSNTSALRNSTGVLTKGGSNNNGSNKTAVAKTNTISTASPLFLIEPTILLANPSGNEVDEEEFLFIPPLNFSMVAKGVYRSGYPNKKNHRFLTKLGLKSIM